MNYKIIIQPENDNPVGTLHKGVPTLSSTKGFNIISGSNLMY